MKSARALVFQGMLNPFVAIKSACGESKYAKYVVEIHRQLWGIPTIVGKGAIDTSQPVSYSLGNEA
jgi:acyl-homoserine lactone acylase PvdQ